MTVASGSTRRREKEDLTAEAFDQLLNWLNPDRDCAARKYEEIRLRLIKIFVCRGCMGAEELADETINRVASKVPRISETYVGDPALYFHGVAERIFLEYMRRKPVPMPPTPHSAPNAEAEMAYACLEQCINGLPLKNRELILAYYGSGDNHPAPTSIDPRRKLAERLGIAANALWIRAHRIREGLRRCVSACVGGRPSPAASGRRARQPVSKEGA